MLAKNDQAANNLTCGSCGHHGFTLTPHEIHGFAVRCLACGQFARWTGKGGGKKSSNARDRRRLQRDGELVCTLCGITESEAKEMGMHFEIDHEVAEDFGGPDTAENKRPLCSACHWTKNAAEHRTRGIRRLLEQLESRKRMYQGYLDRQDARQ